MKLPAPATCRHWIAAFLMVSLTTGMGFFVQQHEFWKIITQYGAFFLLYLAVCFGEKQATNSSAARPSHLGFYLRLAILLRLLLVFSLPNLSNDFYRFIWDGRLLVQGHNPFEHLPLYYLENGVQVQGIDRALFEAFDSKNTYSVYPPLAQWQFASACRLFPGSIYGAVVVMKLWLFAFEAGSIFLLPKLLKKFGLPEHNVLLYALNPLILFEIVGNVHFEGAMIFFLLLALWLVQRYAGLAGSAVAFALSVCSKLLPLLFLPFLVKPLGWGRSLRYYIVVGVTVVLMFLPVLDAAFLFNFASSLNLYFQKLEYNASLYYLLRWVGYLVWGYNRIAFIGPLLGVVAAVGVLVIAWKTRSDWLSVVRGWLFAICFYLLCTTTLHPWYLALPVVLCVFTVYRFPILWSGLVFLTYINYSYEPYRENLWVVAFEYIAVGAWFCWECRGCTFPKKTVGAPLPGQGG